MRGLTAETDDAPPHSARTSGERVRGPLRARRPAAPGRQGQRADGGSGIAYAEEALREAAGDHRREVDVSPALATLRHFRTEWHAAVDCGNERFGSRGRWRPRRRRHPLSPRLACTRPFSGWRSGSSLRRAIELEAQVGRTGASSGPLVTLLGRRRPCFQTAEKERELDEARLLLDRNTSGGGGGDEQVECPLRAPCGAGDHKRVPSICTSWNDEAMALPTERAPDDEALSCLDRPRSRLPGQPPGR